MKNSFAQLTNLIPSSVRQTVIMLGCAIVLTMAVSMLPNSAFAQSCVPASTAAGSLDTCFGNSGKVITSINNGAGSSWSEDVTIQSDGKLVVAGRGDNSSGSGRDFYVLRYNSDGVLDVTFGSGGIARIAFTKSTSDSEYATALAIQPDGKVIVVGYAPIKGNTSGLAVARLNANGSPDTSFGSGGKVLFVFQNNVSAVAAGVTIQSNGYIVVAGRSNANFAAPTTSRFKQ